MAGDKVQLAGLMNAHSVRQWQTCTYFDEVLRWQGLKDWHKEVGDVFVAGVFALEQKVLVMEENLAVHVLH